MMENLQGNVDQISAQNNACSINGVWYTLGPKVQLNYVKKGPVEYSIQQTPPGQNDLVVFIKSAGQTQQPVPQGAPQQYPGQPIPQQPDKREEEINRMSAIKAASRIYEGTGQEEDFKKLTNDIGHYIEQGFWASATQ